MPDEKHKINNLSDMIKCTNSENIDNFLLDLKGVILAGHLIMAIAEDKEKEDIQFSDFWWIDDNKHNISIEIKEHVGANNTINLNERIKNLVEQIIIDTENALQEANERIEYLENDDTKENVYLENKRLKHELSKYK